LAEANQLNGDQVLPAGQTLVVPARQSSAFQVTKAYDANQVLGDTHPNLPVPQPAPRKRKCVSFLIILIVVAFTVYVAGAASIQLGNASVMAGGSSTTLTLGTSSTANIFSAGIATLGGGGVVGGVTVASGWGTLGAAALGAAVGSAVGQGAAIAAGLQDKFNWKAVGLAALSGGVAAGVGWQSAGWLKGGEGLTRWLASAGRAAISNTVTQGLSVVLGLKPEFNWSEVVASALSAGIGAGVNAGAQRLIEPLKLGRMGEVMASTLGGIAGARAALAYRGGVLDVRQIATDAFGNALANSLVESLPATATAQPSPDGRWQQQLDDRLNEQLQDQRDFEDSLKDQAGQAMLESRRGQAPDNNDNSASTTPAMTADELMRLEKSQGYDRGRYVRVQKGDALTRLTADQVEFGATIAYNRLRYPNHIEVGQDLFIPERGTYNEEAAKQVANAYWKAEEAAQEAARLQRIKAESETQEGRWYQSASSSPRQERTIQELRDYFNNMENSPGYQAVQYIRKNPGGSSFVKDMVDVIRPLNSGFGMVFTIAADYLGEKQAGLTGYNSVTHQFYGPDEQRDIRRSLALDAMLSAVPFGRLGVMNRVAGNSIGVPVTRSTNPLSLVREFDVLGNEITYRTMSPAQAKQFELTGRLPPTTETSMAASLEYASGIYTKNGGITFKLTTKPGTSAQLQEIGIAAPGDARVVFPDMSTRNGPWMQTNARFKVEGGQMTTQLGQGRALDIFNENLIDFVRLPKGGH
jgi:hypothetical protein